jgi:hypothetical protein
LIQLFDFLVLLLFNSLDDILFYFVKARFEFGKAFIEDTSHTHKHFTYLLRHTRAERRFKLWLHSFDDCFSVPLAWLIERDKGVLDIQYFSDNDLHLIFGLVTLALNNMIISKDLDDSAMHLKNSLSKWFFSRWEYIFPDIFQFSYHIYLILMGLQESQVRLDQGPCELLGWWGRDHF